MGLSNNYSIPIALILGSLIIGASNHYSNKINKYEISTSPLGVYRLDKISGKVDYCQTKLDDDEENWIVDCSGKYIP